MECFVFVRFVSGQPGFLDFSYRIKALSGAFKLTVISNFQLDQAEMLVPGVRYIVIEQKPGRAGWLHYLWKCARLVRHSRPDLAVLLHSTLAPAAILTGKTPTALYWNEHPTHFVGGLPGLNPVRNAVRNGLRWLVFEGARRADLVMPIGEAHRDELLERGVPPSRNKLIYMGVDEAFRRIPGERRAGGDDTLELVYTGTVSKARGRDIMLEGLALAVGRGIPVRLTLVGASPEEQAFVQSSAQTLGIAAHVSVYGRVPGTEIPGFVSRADMGICIWEDQPWWRFNPPTKLFEYLVAGLPVLASDIRTHTAYVETWRNGVIFEYDAAAFASTVTQVWENRHKLPAMRCAALETSKPYLWNNIEPAFIEAMRGLSRHEQ